jgi:hypothetical protein
LTPSCGHIFANTPALQAFWALDEQQRRKLWGATINPTDALADFDPRYISDAQLSSGRPRRRTGPAPEETGIAAAVGWR